MLSVNRSREKEKRRKDQKKKQPLPTADVRLCLSFFSFEQSYPNSMQYEMTEKTAYFLRVWKSSWQLNDWCNAGKTSVLDQIFRQTDRPQARLSTQYEWE
jgi:hypothetical protein